MEIRLWKKYYKFQLERDKNESAKQWITANKKIRTTNKTNNEDEISRSSTKNKVWKKNLGHEVVTAEMLKYMIEESQQELEKQTNVDKEIALE